MRCARDAIIALYCRDLLPVPEVARKVQRCRYTVYEHLKQYDVARTVAACMSRTHARWLYKATVLREAGVSYNEIARRLGIDRSMVPRCLLRHEDAMAPWVGSAVVLHRLSVPWPDIAQRLNRHVDDVKCFVSRRVGYYGGIEEITT